jgi:uncharacterized membrane protein YraQ (UPF0718 family)
LQPVLQTPLLGIHVSVIMLAYTLFAVMMINGILGLCMPSKRETLMNLSQVLLYPALFCLTAGIFIGAVWANMSWGRYWGWDPKETWALITMLVYALLLHFPWLKKFSIFNFQFSIKLKEALQFGFVEMMGDIGKWLVIGLIIAGLITVFVPESFFTIFKGDTLMSMLLVLCIAIPMYICATGSIPIAVALMLKGLTPGAALVLLMAGPACNMASILVINKVLGRKTLFVYLFSIITMAICWGCIVDYCLPQEWFMTGMMAKACHEAGGTSWFNIGCTILLTLLLLNVLRLHIFHKHEGGHCCCHEHEHKHEEEHCCCHHH